MYKSAYILENDTHKILLDFPIKLDHLISAWRSKFMLINMKKEYQILDFAVQSQGENKIKRKE